MVVLLELAVSVAVDPRAVEIVPHQLELRGVLARLLDVRYHVQVLLPLEMPTTFLVLLPRSVRDLIHFLRLYAIVSF